MKFCGEIIVPASKENVFNALKDAEFFVSCIEGVRDLQAVDEKRYTAVMDTKVAYIRFKFDVEVEITRIEPNDVIEAKVEGVPVGIVGRLTGKSSARLEQRGPETAINYSIDVALAGKLGALGQPVLQSKAREMERSFTSKLQAAFQPSESGP